MIRLSRLPWPLRHGAFFALLVVALYVDPLFLRRNFAGRDLPPYNLPMEKMVHDAYSRLRLPVWSPDISGGRPLLPNPNAGALYPVRPILSVFRFPTAMRIFPVLHWIAAGMGMLLLLRSLGASDGGAWIAAVTYVFSGVGVAEVFFPHIHPGMALIPWIVWAVARPASSETARAIVLSFLYGLIFLAGDVFTSGMAVAATVVWIAFETRRPDKPRRLLSVGAAIALGGLLAAPQVVATALWVPLTNRGVMGMTLFESLFFSIHPLRLLELVIPFPFGACWSLEGATVWGFPVFHWKGMGLFTTLYAGAFAVIAVVVTRKDPGRGFRTARFLLLASVLLAVIPSLVPESLEKLSSPLPLRNPEKFAVLIAFSLSLIAGLGFDRIAANPLRRRWPLAVSVLLAAGTVIAVCLPDEVARVARLIHADRFEKIAADQIPRALAEGAFLWTLTVIALDAMLRHSRVASFVVLGLLTAVPILANRKIARTLTESELFSPPLFARLLGRMDPANSYRTLGEALYRPRSNVAHAYNDGDGRFPASDRRMWTHYVNALWGRGTVFNDDFDVGDLSRLQTLRRFSVRPAGSADSQPFFGSLSLRWATRFRGQEPLAGYTVFGGDVATEWDILESAEPDIRVPRSLVEVASGLEALAALRDLKEGEIVLETGRRRRRSSPPAVVHVRAREPERLVVETVAEEATWLFVLRGFWPYRTILVNGRAVEPVPAQGAFTGVPIPNGRHRIEWVERVPAGKLTRWGPVAWGALATLLAVAERKRTSA